MEEIGFIGFTGFILGVRALGVGFIGLASLGF